MSEDLARRIMLAFIAEAKDGRWVGWSDDESRFPVFTIDGQYDLLRIAQRVMGIEPEKLPDDD